MQKRNLALALISGAVVVTLCLFIDYWMSTQPIFISEEQLGHTNLNIPEANQLLLQYTMENGRTISPTYESAVCTEFVIEVLSSQRELSTNDKLAIRIITSLPLDSLISQNAEIIQGVASALVRHGNGRAIDEPEDVLPGDLVQFWNIHHGKAYGHCGIVADVSPHKTLTLYSSHPATDGFGLQTFLWPDFAYFVRLN